MRSQTESYWESLVCKESFFSLAALKTLSLSSDSLIMMCQVWISLTLYCLEFVEHFVKRGKFPALISLKLLSASFLLSSPSGTPVMQMFAQWCQIKRNSVRRSCQETFIRIQKKKKSQWFGHGDSGELWTHSSSPSGCGVAVSSWRGGCCFSGLLPSAGGQGWGGAAPQCSLLLPRFR